VSRRPEFKLSLPKWHEWSIYVCTAVLVLTGVAWLIAGSFGAVQGEFGQEPNPSLPWLLMVHGIGAYAFAILAAMLVPVHIRLGWRASRNRLSGIAMVSVSLFLATSGLALYYSTGEGFRSAVSLAHWVVGLGLALLLAVHIMRGKGSRPRRAKSQVSTSGG